LSEVEEQGIAPSWMVAIDGCDWKCLFCNAPTAGSDSGFQLDDNGFDRILAEARSAGAETIQITGGEPARNLPLLFALVTERSTMPVVLNTSLPEGITTDLELLKPFAAIITTFKFGSDRCAQRIAGISRYVEPMQNRITKLAKAGLPLIVRHLLMPGHYHCCWQPVAQWLTSQDWQLPLSLLTGFMPPRQAPGAPELLQSLLAQEVQDGVALARSLDVHCAISGERAGAFLSGSMPVSGERAGETLDIVIGPTGRISLSGLNQGTASLVQSLRPPTPPSDNGTGAKP
jgi:putative pyruvate formate lyase activating enzyme